MDVNELKLNHDKTEIMLIYSIEVPYSSTKFSYFSIDNERLTTTANARSLGVVLDDNMLPASTCTFQTFADHRFASLGTYQRLENISHGSLVKLLCMLS